MASAGARAKVPVAEVALEAYRDVFGRLNLFFDLAWLPLLIVLGAAILPGYLQFAPDLPVLPHWPGDALGLGIETLIEAVAGILCLNAFAVRWHQSLLFTAGRQPEKSLFRAAWLRFIAYTLLLYALSAVVITILLTATAAGASAMIAALGGVLMIVVWIGLVRCALIFPAAAFGRPLALSAAWRILRGNSWRLFACAIVVCAPTIFTVVFVLTALFAGFHLDRFGDAPLPLGFFLLRAVIGSCANFIVVALGASVLSAFYRRIMVQGL